MPTAFRPSFGARVVVAFVAILLLLQAATFVIVEVAVGRNVHAQLADRVDVGVRVWRQIHADQAGKLAQAVATLASDFAFRKALATGDASTVLSALANHSQRIDADAALLLGVDGALQTSTLDGDEDRQATALRPLLDAARRDGSGAGVVLFDGRPYEVALVPVMAPRLIGWVAMGRPFGAREADSYRSLTGLDAAFAIRAGDGWRLQASSLAAGESDALARLLRAAHDRPEVRLGARHFHVAAIPVDPALDGGIELLLLADVDEAMQPYLRLKRQILLLATGSLGLVLLVSVAVGRGVSRPVARLAAAARRIEAGDYAETLPLAGGNELSELASAFNHMQDGIADREARIRHQASHDNLTGLPNRVHALATLATWLQRAQAAERPCAVVMLDLDRFKEINDTLGHAFGDGVLTQVAERLRGAIRHGDVLARLGGDEFMVLLESTGEAAARERAWALKRALDQPLHVGDGQAQVSVDASIGLALYPAHGHSPDALLRRADIAMYEAKRAQGHVAVYQPGHDEAHLRRIRLIGDLRRARERGEFALVFQPKIDLVARRVAHVEALLRWRHPDLGSIAPDEFIPLAEHCGLIHEITAFVVEEGLRHAAALRADGIDIGLAINLSAMDLVGAHLPDRVSAALRRSGFPARELILEITESTVMRDTRAALVTMRALRAMGIRLSIDDFGTGHSSLAQLRSLPVDEIKIDKSFVMQLDHSPEDTVIVRSAIEIGHNMGLTVIAEGVEQAGSLEILRALKCDMVQGYLFSRPIPAAQFRQWYATFDLHALLVHHQPEALA